TSILPSASPRMRVLAVREELRAALFNILAFLCTAERPRHVNDDRISIRIEEQDGRPCLVIRDKTLVLTAEDKRRIFDPSIEVDTRAGRTLRMNVTLAHAYQMLHRRGAQVLVNTGSTGTEFRVLLSCERK